ncbi:MAG: LysE family transporter [Tissierellia bacterium]|nr:LysE family transporter [Tissierellia bacterium]
MTTYLQGLALGFAYVAPLGMQNIFVINNALMREKKQAILTTLAVIFFDITLAMACFYGIGMLMETRPLLQKIVIYVGGALVVYIGITLLVGKVQEIEIKKDEHSLSKAILQAGIVTWLNPQAIIDGTLFLGAFRASLDPLMAKYFIGGVMSASFLWFTFISLGVHFFRGLINTKVLQWIQWICGAVLVFYGGRLLLSGIF